MKNTRGILRPLLFAVSLAALPFAAVAQEEGDALQEPSKPWSNEAQVSFVDTAGNSSSRTFAVANRFVYNWTYSELIVSAEAFRASSQSRELTNTISGVVQTTTDRIDAERYELAGKYRMNMLDDLFWYGHAGWYRNRPAGTDSRVTLGGGFGYRFWETDRSLFAGEAGLAYVDDSPVEGPSDGFVTARGFLELRHQISETSSFNTGVELLPNLQDTSDLRINASAAVNSQLTGLLALRVSWDLKYDNQPATQIVDSNPDAPPGLFVLDKTDRTLSASLVLSF